MSEWIDIKERMPEVGKTVAVAIRGDDHNYTSSAFRQESYWHVFAAASSADCRRITHWAPLPDPPRKWTKEEAILNAILFIERVSEACEGKSVMMHFSDELDAGLLPKLREALNQ